MSSNTYYVYLITAKIKNKLWFYVGKTKNVDERWYEHKYNAITQRKKSISYLHRKMIKYGVNLFNITIISSFTSEKDSLNNEKLWIALLKSNKCRYKNGFGMNMTDGGEGISGWKHRPDSLIKMSKVHKGKPGKKQSKEQRDRRSKFMKIFRLGKKHSQATLEKMSKSQIGKKRSAEAIAKTAKANTGIKHSEKSKLNMSKSKIGLKYKSTEKRLAESIRRGRPIIVIDENGIETEFYSINKACQDLGLNDVCIYRVLRGTQISTKGYKVRDK